jgi:hypothetical protein
MYIRTRPTVRLAAAIGRDDEQIAWFKSWRGSVEDTKASICGCPS